MPSANAPRNTAGCNARLEAIILQKGGFGA